MAKNSGSTRSASSASSQPRTNTPRFKTASNFVYSEDYRSRLRAVEKVIDELETLATYATSRYEVEDVFAKGTSALNEFTDFAYSTILNDVESSEAAEARTFVREAERTLINRLDDARNMALDHVDWDEEEK